LLVRGLARLVAQPVRLFTTQAITFASLFHEAPASETYTLSLHDALPIWKPGAPERRRCHPGRERRAPVARGWARYTWRWGRGGRSEEHTSELQSRSDLVWRLLLEKKKASADAQALRLSIDTKATSRSEAF